MWHRLFLFWVSSLLIGWLCGSTGFVARAADSIEERYEPGLTGRAADSDRTVRFTAPTPHFNLSPGQSIHPQLRPQFELEWSGYLRVLRGDRYTFFGEGRLFLNDEPVSYGQAVSMEPGYIPLRIEFQREPGPAGLNLRWRSGFFQLEPMPSRVFWRDPSGSDDTDTRRIELGRRLVEQFHCQGCHQTDAGFWRGRPGPDLSSVGSRTRRDWIYHFLENPQEFRSGAVMPVILESAQARADVAAFLAKSKGPDDSDNRLEDSPDGSGSTPAVIQQGKDLFEALGCRACHQDDSLALDGLGSKYSATSLTRYLMDPLAVDPSGRMPDFNLDKNEARTLAQYLVQSRQPEFEHPAPPGDPARGREWIADNGCLACHALEEEPKLKNRQVAPGFESLNPQHGCLADSPSDRVPHFAISNEERNALRAFVRSPDVSPAPIQDFHRTIEQFQCRACHEVYRSAQHELAEAPPPLTVAGRKLRTDWLEAVLFDRKRVRPWMDLRMPHYGRENLQGLPEWFAAQAGLPAGHGEDIPGPPKDQVTAGVTLLGQGEGGLACISCHDVQGHRAVGEMRGPDLTEMYDRIRPDWFRRWMRDPARVIPGTAMPAFFSGMPDSQSERMIGRLLAALSTGEEMPLPEGVLKPEETFRLVVRDQPMVIRTFMPYSSPQSIAVGLPGGLNYCFDAAACRFRYGWQGGFLDMEPVWNGRGGRPPRVLGTRNYIAREEVPIRFGDPNAEPETQFLGYRLIDGIPQFRYRVDGALVKERVTGTQDNQGFVRRFEIGPVQREIWYLARESPEWAIRSSVGEFSQGRLRIPGTGKVRFDVTVSLQPLFE